MNAIAIVDTRRINPEIIENHCLRGWDVVVFTTKINDSLKEIFKGIRLIYIDKINTATDYNRLLTSAGFWYNLDYERVLIFQQDSRLLNNNISPFLEYDYIGAPIKNFNYPAMNGGLSLRSPKMMIKAIQSSLLHPTHNEDIRFSYTLEKLGANLPDEQTAKTFSVETQFYDRPFGVHACQKYLPKEQLNRIKNYDKLPI